MFNARITGLCDGVFLMFSSDFLITVWSLLFVCVGVVVGDVCACVRVGEGGNKPFCVS